MRNSASFIRGAAPETPRFIALAPESLCYFGAASTAPAIPASESALGRISALLYPPLRCFQNGPYQPRRAMIFHWTAIPS